MARVRPISRKRVMTAEEMNRLRETAQQQALSFQPDDQLTWMLIDMATQTGLRVGELASIRIKDFDFELRSLDVVRLKKKHRERDCLPISASLQEHVQDWIHYRALLGGSVGPDDSLFVERSVSALERMFHRVRRAAGLPARLSIHTSRHGLATALLSKTGRLDLVQQQLGHSSITTTRASYAHTRFEDQQSALDHMFG